MRSKYKIGIICLIMLIVGTGAVILAYTKSGLSGFSFSGTDLSEKPPAITITAGTEKKDLIYETLPNKWNQVIYDRPDYREVLFEKLDTGKVNSCRTGDTVTFDFGGNQPQKLKLQADQYTDRAYAQPPEVIEIPLQESSFQLYLPYTGINNSTFFILTATWDNDNEAEYVFIINSTDPVTDESRLQRYILTEKGEVFKYYRVKEQNGKQGLFAENSGKQILPCEFDQFMIHNAMVAAKKDGKWLLYDYSGQRLSQDEWDEIIKTTTPMDNEVNGLVRVCKNGVWGCVNQQGKVVIPPNWDTIDLNYYEEVEPFLRVIKDGKFGYLTYDGKMLLEPEWDMAIMDVYNAPLDLIFVRRGDEWGSVKVVNNVAGEVDWTRKPSKEFQFGFMDERYQAQAQTMSDLLFNIRGITTSTIVFFDDYYRKNDLDLLYMPDFGNGQELDWDLLTQFVYTRYLMNRSAETGEKKGEVSSSLTVEEFDSVAKKYFLGLTYQHQSSHWLNYQDGRYTPVGWSDHGFRRYYLSELVRLPLTDGNDTFKATLIGYQFWEEDFDKGSDRLSPNMKALQNESRKLRYQGKTLEQVLDEVMAGDPTILFTPAVEQTIEFTIHNPTGDVWLQYAAASRKEIAQ